MKRGETLSRKKEIEKRKKFMGELLADPLYRPMRLGEIAGLLRLSGNQKKELAEILEELIQEGRVLVDGRGRYSLSKGKKRKRLEKAEEKREKRREKEGRKERGKPDRERSREKSRERNRSFSGAGDRDQYEDLPLEGTFIGHYKGFGFVELEGEEQDIYIPEEDTGSAMHLDKVSVLVKKEQEEGRRREGVVVKVLERGMTEIVGTYQSNRDYGFVISDNPKFSKDVFIPKRDSMGARDGYKVVAQVTDYGSKNKSPEGRITEVLGSIHAPGTDILAIVKSFGIPSEFPQRVIRQAERVPDHVLDADREGRLDLRDLLTVTIDGEDAKDLDDAVTLTKEGGLYHLGVHIADVSNYVQGGSALDREAQRRGTSVYLADRVIPMLPERLSNGICSLNQGQDRLTLSCLMDIDQEGRMVSHRIAETVIRVDERMSYTDVKNILEETDPRAAERYHALLPMFFAMKELSAILRKSRRHRGSIDFDLLESKILLDEAGRVVDICPYEANVATRIIEDFMLMANETVAEECCKEDLPFVYRTHENPDPDKVESLLTLLRNQGVAVRKEGQEITPKEIQMILENIEGLPNEAQISRMTLRTMKQAKYTTHCTGHFGLAARYYCHFTSPIRRYPDLQIHRIIKDRLRGRLEREGRTQHYRELLEEVAVQSSACERRAQEAERESDKLKKAEYMAARLGQEYEGIISGVTGWGFYVELPNTVEGLVHVNTLRDDYYVFDQDSLELRGDLTKKVFRLGQKVRIRVADADVLLKTVDFEVI
ncbi:MAG: ribonuclease R [Eubacteriales bacterium]|nr:ribonuclease R [Eubacteriales bacterium]